MVEARGGVEPRRLFRAYYSLEPPLEEPRDIAYREFAFQLFEGDAYVRHLGFDSVGELLSYMAREAPKNAYYSVARYSLPTARSMEEKGWLGSELMFDIDVDILEGCGEGIGDECLHKGYRQASRLVEILYRDFGVASTLYFTGNRGFHVLADCEWCRALGRGERREVARYFTLEGLKLELVIPRPGRRGVKPAPPSPDDPGLRGWIARAAIERGLDPSEIVDAAEEILDDVRIAIDVKVTQDISRLARIVGSLNGKAGLFVARLGLEGFHPGDWLSPFRGEVEFRSEGRLEEARIMGSTVSLEPRRVYSMPAHIAVLLQLRGYGAIVGGEIVVRAGSGRGPL
ncbi:DNA primase small subunit [Aeropyrum camini SY1 = JCM 12091]|uniref:DNA primase small subunit PriS n=1 Tax=Aeropyrum camini SY1 = JCM 12091 TaxID=1198449 RepID=U3T8D0_9CREN|nr:DNA primase small subunit [Aeropyrum camini SY1 = JCM 12091]